MYCRYPLSYRDLRDPLAERGIINDAAQYIAGLSGWPPIGAIGQEVKEMRVRDATGALRRSVAKFAAALYVLHCLQKKSQRTTKADLDVATKRYRDVVKEQAMSNERFASVWDATEDTPAQADSMKLRSALMMGLKAHSTRAKLDQSQASSCSASRNACIGSHAQQDRGFRP